MSFRAIESLRFQIIEFLIFLGDWILVGWGRAKKTSRAVTAREAKKSLLQTFWCGIARSAQFHKFKLNVIACFTMKKHINHNAKLIHT